MHNTHCTICDTFLTLQLNLIPYSQNESCFGWLGRGVMKRHVHIGMNYFVFFQVLNKKDAEPIHCFGYNVCVWYARTIQAIIFKYGLIDFVHLGEVRVL